MTPHKEPVLKSAALALILLCVALAGCSIGAAPSGAPLASLQGARHGGAIPALQYFTPTPPPGHLYVDHNGSFYVYALPLSPKSKPVRAGIAELPGSSLPPQIAADQFGRVAIASPTEIDLFRPPLVSFAPARAYLKIPLTPAITQIGPSGADLADIEFDPNLNLWLLNNYGGGQVTELQSPLQKYGVAAATILFGVPGTKAGSYGALREARFDVNATAYVYATQPQGQFSLLFKSSFPYAAFPSPVDGLDLSTPDFVDPSQWPNGPPPALAGGLLLGQYNGSLASPAPGRSPTPPVSVLAQFNLPFVPVNGVYPSAVVQDVSGGLIADPARMVFYSLSEADGALDVYALPLTTGAKPFIAIPCAARTATFCDNKPEHVFLAP